MLDDRKKLWLYPLLALLVMASLSIACGGSSEEQPTSVPTRVTQPTQIVPPAEADLLLGPTYVDTYPDSYLTYQIVATIENAGAGDASGFNAGCTYECLPGDMMSGGGMDITQDGVISAHSSFTYQTPFHFQCEIPPLTLQLECSITSAQGATRSYSVNVTLP